MGTRKRWVLRIIDRAGKVIDERHYWTKWGADRQAARYRELAESYSPFVHGPLFTVVVTRSTSLHPNYGRSGY